MVSSVLIVDDDEIFRNSLKSAFEKRRMRAWSMQSLDGVIANSHAALADSRANEPLEGLHQAVIPNIVEPRWYADQTPLTTGSDLPCIATVANLARAVERLKEAGFWTYVADMGGQSLPEAELQGRVALVLGAEGSGVSRLLKERCDGALSP